MKNWIKGANSTVITIAVVGIFILLTLFLSSLSGLQWDLTTNKKYTLSDQTLEVLKSLDRDVHAIAFTEQSGSVSPDVSGLLDEYHKRNKRFTWEEVNPIKEPSIAKKYEVTSYGTVVFESGGKTVSVSSYDLYNYNYYDYSYSFNGEAEFTSALIKLTSDKEYKGYFLTGHGELTVSQAYTLQRGLSNDNMTLTDLNLIKDGEIPEDADTIFVLGPVYDLSDEETEKLLNYLDNGGKLFMTIGIVDGMEEWTNWPKIMEKVGIKSQSALVVESGDRALANDPFTIIPNYGIHDIVNKLDEQNRIAIMPASLALTTVEGSELTAKVLLRTSNKAYGKTNLSYFTSATQIPRDAIAKAEGDLEGPLNIAYAIEDANGNPKAVVVGNSAFLQNTILQLQGNLDFALNSVGWLQERQDLVSIRPREEAALEQAYIKPNEADWIFYGTIVAFPLMFLVAGSVVWWRRRKG